MRNSVRFLIIFLFVLAGCGFTSGPEKYVASVEQIQTELAGRIYDITRYSEELDSTLLWKAYHETLDYAENAVYKLQELGPFRGDSILLKAALRLMSIYQQVLNQEVQSMAKIVSRPGELSDADELRLQRLRRAMFVKLAEAERNFLKDENAFRRKYSLSALNEEDEGTWFGQESDTTGS
ncbi:MAG: LIC11966 family surface protein [Bacteroidales bacterium]